MPLLASLRRRREAIYATMRCSPRTNWPRDLAQALILLTLLVMAAGFRAWWVLWNVDL